MPWDFDHAASGETGLAHYPADRPGWCEAIVRDAPPPPVARRAARRGLPDSDDLLGWSVLVLTAPLLAVGALLLASQAALPLL